MMDTKKQAGWIRRARWVHRKLAVAFMLFFFIISLTGLLLGIKKQTGLLAPTQKGASTDAQQWLSLSELQNRAVAYLHDSVGSELSVKLDRIDIRPEKGIAKFVFVDHYFSVQVDCTTGALLSIEERTSDFIENIHDGSILDRWLGTGEAAKVGYTVMMGASLLTLVTSGLWLWYGPKRLRRAKRNGV